MGRALWCALREIYAYSFKTGCRLSNDLAIDLLRDNDRKKLGAWRIVGSDDKQVAAYAVQVSADADADSFKAAIDIVKTVAHEREKAETGRTTCSLAAGQNNRARAEGSLPSALTAFRG